MAITISQEPKRSRDGTEVFFVAIDNGMWFEFEATGSPIESKCRVDVYLADNTKINANDIVLFFGVDNKVFFDASPYIQPYLNNDNGNTYQSAVETDSNASQGFYLKYGEFPIPSPDDVANSSTYYASKSAKQFGDTYGQNMASYWAASSQVVLAKLLTKVKTLPYWSGFPFSLSFINNSYVDTANITQLSNTGAELSNVDYPALTDNTIEQINILSIDASAKKINVSLVHTPAFTFTVDTSKGDGLDQFIMPLVSSEPLNFVVDWGDSQSDIITVYTDPALTHSYSTGGIYTIKITGTISGWKFNDGGDNLKMGVVSEWGTLNLSVKDAFYGCSNMTVTAPDIFTVGTDCEDMFRGCSSITTFPGLNDLDVSNCIDLDTFFYQCTNFNDNISSWDVTSCRNFSNMFAFCDNFNQDLSSWRFKTTGDISFNQMFYFAKVFDCGTGSADLTGWNVERVTDMTRTFAGCDAFNKSLAGWNTSNCIDMKGIFSSSELFKQDLSSWNFQAVTNFSNFLNGVDINNPYSKTLGSPAGDNSNYDALITKLQSDAAAVDPAQDNLSFHGGNSEYTAGGAVQTAHDALTAATPGGNGWTIVDGGST